MSRPPAEAVTDPHPADTDAAAADLLQLVSFEIGVEEYAIPILAVREINRVLPITAVPHAPRSVEGVINLRGQIIPVVDLRRRFGLPPCPPSAESRIVVVEVGHERRVVGFTVDRVHEVLRLDPDIVDPAPAAADPGPRHDAGFVTGVGRLDHRLLILVDLDRLFTAADLEQAHAAAHAA